MVAGTDCGRLLADSISLVRICKETIYRFIYGKEDYGLGLYRYLPEARRKRHPRGSRKPRNSVFPASHRISQHPDFISDRSKLGHWEGDLLIFERKLGHANLTSLVEPKSRYTVMIKNQSRHTRPIMDKIIREFSPLQAFARQSFTFDRGTEFAGFRVLEDGIGVRSWFAIPVHPGRKVLLRMQTSAFADSCQAIRILQPSPSKTSLTLPATSTICRENASAPKHQSRCSWRIFAKKAGPLP